jgi:hypothetical protein
MIDESSWVGVAIQLPDGNYSIEPPNMSHNLYKALKSLNCKVAFTMSSEITTALIDQLSPLQQELQVHPRGIKVNIVQSLQHLASGKTVVTKKSYLCILREEKVVLVWGDSVEGILNHGADVEGILVGIVRRTFFCRRCVGSLLRIDQIWGSHIGTLTATSPYHSLSPPFAQTPASAISSDPEYTEKLEIIQAAIEREENKDTYFDPDIERAEAPKRPFLLLHASVVGVAMTLVILVEMLCIARVPTPSCHPVNEG